MTPARTSLDRPDWVRSSSWTAALSALEEWTARTPARETEGVLWSVRLSPTPTPTSRPVLWPGASAVGRTEPRESTLTSVRPPAGSTRPFPATTAVSSMSPLRISPRTSATPATSVRSGWRTRSTNWRRRETELEFGKIFQGIIDRYTSCHGFGVGWEEPNAPIIDPAPRDDSYNTEAEDSYNTNDKIVEAEDSYNTNDKIVEAEDSNNTNEKLIEAEDSYNTNEKIVEAEDSYNTNDKLVGTGDSYNTNQKIVEQSAPVTCGTPPPAKIVDLEEEDEVKDEAQQY